MFGNPVKPVNINQTDFNSFDNYDFMNSQIKQVSVIDKMFYIKFI